MYALIYKFIMIQILTSVLFPNNMTVHLMLL